MRNATPTNLPVSNELISNPSLATLLRQQLSQEDLIDLGLIRNPIYDNHQVVKEIQQELAHYQDDASERGIEYAGSLSASEEVSAEELARALDPSDLMNIKEQSTPALRRNNFWYVDKQRNEQDHYTRYLLANGGERIVTDDEMQSNSWFAYQRNLSDAREDGDTDLYNQLKAERKATHSLHLNEDNADTHEQCFLKMGTKLYGDVMNVPTSLLKDVNKNKRQLISYLDMFQSPIKQLLKLQTKIKLININNKTIAIL